LVRHYCVHNEEDAWIADQWEYVLKQLECDPMELRDRLDWVAKKFLLQEFIENEKLSWQDPWLHSLDLEYHNLDPRRGLYHGLVQSKVISPILAAEAIERASRNPPENTRARARGFAVQQLMDQETSYIINWDSIALQGIEPLRMDNPFYSYINEVQRLLNSRPTVRQEPPKG
jgi:proteasome accessory factor A